MSDLKHKTLVGTSWEALRTILNFSVQFIVSIILARLLTPDDYGLIGMIMVFIAIADCITISGFFSSLLQKNNVTEGDLNTMFVSNIVSSSVLYIILFFTAPLIASFFGRTELISLLRVQALVLIISAFSLVQRAKLSKELNFKTPTKVSFIASIVGGVTGVIMAFIGFGVWALVLSSIFSSIVTSILYCTFNKWLPKIKFSIDSFKELFGYGWKILVAELFDSIYMQIYQVVVGRCYSPATLGQYSRAKGFSDMISTNLYNITRGVTFPVLCQIQDDKNRSKEAFRRMIRMMIFVTAISSAVLIVVAKPLILTLIGAKWLPCVIYLQILCLGSLLYPINATNMNLIKSQGKSGKYLILSIIRKIIEIIPICLGIFISITYMVIGMVVVNWIAFIMYSHFAGKTVGYSTLNQLMDMMPSFIIAILIAVPTWAISFIPLHYVVQLAIQGCVAILLFIAIGKLSNNAEYVELISYANAFVNKAKTFTPKKHE